ncbi:DUF3810 domain-containing protein [Maribacter sp. 2210JD10-5]|uniref:DUF3810 domain-containing protein n=1 Tax=Maribacter sp. 2210JD10-5 TaxID=3386272 RepID=UPI0039BC86A2
MKISLKTGIALSLVPQIVLVKLIGNQTQFIEHYYSNGLYPFVSKLFRTLFGWIPFSLGDILYFLLILLALGYVCKNRRPIWKNKLKFCRNILMVLSIAYFTFHVMWGFNYYREPVAQKLGLKETNDYQELIDFTKLLIAKTNRLQLEITKDSTQKVIIPYSQNEIFEKSLEGYYKISRKHGFPQYEKPSTKTSLFSTGLSYMGYAGYLNPFTNEAQVNGRLPNFRFPVVAAHEMGHQLGYSAENETNFIGYLVTAENEDLYFQYAASAYALGYCLSDIRRGDQEIFDTLFGELNQGVLLNFQEMRDFWTSFENPLEPVFKAIFSSFLKANNQSKGIQSYNAVVSLLVAYHKQYPL